MVIDSAVSDSGPLIHLAQIGALDVLSVSKKILIPEAVFNEVSIREKPGSPELRKSKTIKVWNLSPKSKNFSKMISIQYSIGVGESESLALSKQENISIVFTDDLKARLVAKKLGLEPHGSVGIILKAFRSGLIKKQRAISLVKDLHLKSTLFITSDLISYIVKEINKTM